MLRIAAYRALTRESTFPVPCTGRGAVSRGTRARQEEFVGPRQAHRSHRSPPPSPGGAGRPTAGVAEATASEASTAGKSPAKPAPPRSSADITVALRGAFRPLDLGGDLRALPRLLIHWSFWGPALATLATTVVYLALAQGRTSVTPSDTPGSS